MRRRTPDKNKEQEVFYYALEALQSDKGIDFECQYISPVVKALAAEMGAKMTASLNDLIKYVVVDAAGNILEV